MNSKIINKFYNYLVILIFIELVLGGLGHMFGLPIRKVLFVLGILSSLFMMYINKVKIKKNYIIPIVLVIGYTAYGSIVGIINGNSLGDIFSDANSFLGILYMILLLNYFGDNFNKMRKIMDLIANLGTIIALITIGLFFYSRVFLPGDQDIIMKYMELEEKLQYGLITGLVQSNNYARVYLFNGIFMQIGAMILTIKILFKNDKVKILESAKLLLLLIGIFVSTTRGFWVGTGVGMVFVLGYYIWKRKERNLTIKRFVVVFVLFYAFTLILPMTIDKTTVPHSSVESGTQNIKDRVESIVDFKNNLSNKIRVIQLEFLVNRIEEKPVLGWGFGAHIEEYGQYMDDNNLPAVRTSNFELYYVELLFKTGALGIIYLFVYLAYEFFRLVRVLIKNKLEKNEEIVLIGWTIAFLSFMASSLTNPYLSSLSGFFMLVMECYILETIIIKYGK